MPIIKVSSKDLMRNELSNPDWYQAKVVKFEIKKCKDGTSLNYVPTVEYGPEGRKKEKEHYFNSKAAGMMEKFIAAVTGEKVDRTKNLEIDTDEYIGKTLQVHVINGEYEGNLQDQFDDWAALGVDKTASGF